MKEVNISSKENNLQIDDRNQLYKIPLSPYSIIFYNEWLIARNRSDYNIAFDQNLQGSLDKNRLKNAIKRFLSDYIILNSHVKSIEGKLYWIRNIQASELEYLDKEETKQGIYNYISSSFDLEKGPLCRFRLIKNSENNYRLVWVLHHIIIGGYSFNHFASELSKYYNDLKYKNHNMTLQNQIHTITRLSEKLSQGINENIEESKLFWKKTLEQVEPLSLSFLCNVNNTSKERHRDINTCALQMQGISEIGELKFGFDKEIVMNLRIISSMHTITPYLYGQFIFSFLLYLYSGENRISFNYPFLINEGKDFIYGAQINTNIFVLDFSEIKTVREAFENIKNFVISLRSNKIKHDRLPIYEIISASNVNLPSLAFIQTDLKNKSLSFEGIQSCVNDDFDINVPAKIVFEHEEHADHINFKVRYKTLIFDKDFVTEFTNSYIKLYRQILNELIKNNASALSFLNNFNLLEEKKESEIIYRWNENDKLYAKCKSINEIFEQQVRKTPNQIAVSFNEINITYKDLNIKANQLAHFLIKECGIKPDTFVPIVLKRSEHSLISLLALLKIGGIYVPIDPGEHKERIRYILKDINAQIIITSEIILKELSQISDSNFVIVDGDSYQQMFKIQSEINPKISITENNLAYLIYTSGTTGTPKGVMIEHRSILNYVNNVESHSLIEQGDVVDFSTNVSFDLTITTTVCALCVGATIVVYDKLLQDIQAYKNHLIENNINVIKLTPNYFELLIEYINELKVQKIILGGEKLDPNIIQKIYQIEKNLNLRIFDEYGPTEATVGACITQVYPRFNNTIGKPYFNCKAYVLNKDLMPLPIGAIGELYLGGLGVARGYLNQPALTAERFIPNPYQTELQKKENKNIRLYKTGDLVRWLPEGNIEYIGRNDFQVKIRGFRVELGAIESCLKQHGDINQVIVIPKKEKKTNNNVLVAYVVVGEFSPSRSELELFLAESLPEYMIPTFFVFLDALPLTMNGKIDRKALPDPECIDKKICVPPRTQLQRKICKLWSNVLGLSEQNIGIHDNFFKLGGHSLLAIRLMSDINRELSKNIDLSLIFKNNTIDKISKYLEYSYKEEIQINSINVSNLEQQILSFSQERLWFIEQYENGTNAYNVPLIYQLISGVQLSALEESVRNIVKRHEILRTLIKKDVSGNAYQVVLDDIKEPLQISHKKLLNQIALDEELKKEVHHIYNLSLEYPIRVYIYEVAADPEIEISYYISFVIHHIAFDGWSVDIFVKELEAYYQHNVLRSKGLESHLNLPNLNIQYKDFALWQRGFLTGDRLTSQSKYWREKLKGYENLNLITDKPRPNQIEYAGSDVYFELTESLSFSLRALAKELGVSLYSLLLSGYCLMLRSYTYQNEIVIGSSIANRNYTQIEHLIGFFVNILALRIKINSESLVCDFINSVGCEVEQAQLYQDFPFGKLVEELKLEKDTSRHPVFQVLFSVESFGGDIGVQGMRSSSNNFHGILKKYNPNENLYSISKFDLSTVVDDSQACLRGIFTYAKSLYTNETIENFVETYIEILNQFASLANDKEKQVREKIYILRYLNDTSQEKTLSFSNNMKKIHRCEQTIHEIFEEQVKRTPNNIAISFQSKKITYKELDERANRLAMYLKYKYKIRPDMLIALCLEKCEFTIISLLAVLKAGGAYVPIDPNYPLENIKFIIEDANVELVITNQKYSEKIRKLWESDLQPLCKLATILIVEDLSNIEALHTPSVQHHSQIKGANLAYVIYTSGTTGRSKGVLQTHANVVRLFKATNDKYDFNCSDVWTLFHSYVFDFSVWEIWGALFYGGRLVIPSIEENNDFYKFYNLCVRENITVLNQTPSAFYQFLDILVDPKNQNKILNLRYVIFGGEKLNLPQLKPWFCNKHYMAVRLINMYGITETTVHVTYVQIDESNLGSKSYIGDAISDLKTYVLNNALMLLPVGAVGELYVAGPGLARGYLNRPELTALRFLPNPFQTELEKQENQNTRLYKTGDLVRRLSCGGLEYIGRNDFQVKIRGYRIELGQIESALASYHKIKQCVVIDKDHMIVNCKKEQHAKYLIAYYVSNVELNEQEICDYLGAKLPNYMIPAFFVHLDKLPLTINGKLDKELLPYPRLKDLNNYVAPETQLEKNICKIWSLVLHLPLEKIGVNDDFFRLGGNSIQAILLANMLKNQLMVDIEVAVLFRNNTIGKLAKYLSEDYLKPAISYSKTYSF